MQWLIEAHEELTSRPVPRLSIAYSGRFRGFNATVAYKAGEWMEFRLAKAWKDVDTDIQKGIVQHLLAKVYRIKRRTMHMELYDEFLRQSSKYQPKRQSEPLLEERFNILNDTYFHGLMEQPAIVWGSFSTTKLGSYEYATDTVTVSTALRDDTDMLDYVLYHELLHKKHQFSCANGRTHHHTPAFRAEERQFRIPDAEARLQRLVAQKRREKRSRQRAARKPSLFTFWR